MTAYGAGTIKRRRRTRAEVEQLDRQIVAVLREDHPQSVRHIFYRMTDPTLAEPVEKSERGYRHVLHRVKELRREGVVPYGWISDTTRRGYFVNTFRDAAEFLTHMSGLYRGDLWRDADTTVEVWVESRSIAGIVQHDCKELAVSLYPCGGFSSITLAYEAAKDINAEYEGKPVHVLYIGDHDPAGVLIDVALERELRMHLVAEVDLTVERVAITPEQIAAYDLPSKPRKAGDARSPEITETVEAEAMPAALLRRLLRDRIESFLPPRALELTNIADESERLHIRRMAEIMRGAA